MDRSAFFRTAFIIFGTAYCLLIAGLFLRERGTIAPLSSSSAPFAAPAMPRIRIPAIGVDAFIQEVGLTPAGAIGIPTNYIDAARFTGSSAFGAGNTIVVGHRDTRLFAPGVFRNLERLRAGDEVRVALSDGTQLAYRVARVQAYAENTDKIPEIVGETTRPRLTLITCTGQWNQSVKRYDQRLVVFADLLEGE